MERDARGVKWVNWGFDGTTHEFFKRTSVKSGAMVTLEVLKKFGLTAEIFSGEPSGCRYVLQMGEQISYLSPSEKPATEFSAREFFAKFPEGVEWIFVDRSANLTREVVAEIRRVLESGKVKLAFYAPKRMTEAARELAERADFVFFDASLGGVKPRGEVCLLGERSVWLGGETVELDLQRAELLTHLTTYSIIAGTVFAARMRGKSAREVLLLAKLNVEKTRLDETLDFNRLEELAKEERRNEVNLEQMAKQLVAPEKGILAADESGGSIHKKFEAMGIPDDEQHRRDYRNLFFTTEGLEKYVNGVILFDETARQRADDGRNFVEFLTAKGIIPGIKVDKGLKNLPGSEEKYTDGLDGLAERLEEYYEMGLRFAKWRAAFEISETTPTKNAIQKNAEILAQYALLCQKANIVPIVEPEVVHEGDYSVEKCAEVTGKILEALFLEMKKQGVKLSGAILKVNMVLSGSKYATPSSPKEVGEWTAKVLRKYVPEELAGVVFLSGGQGVEEATNNLQEVTNNGPFPWAVTFSFARALQAPALEAWKGDNANYPEAKKAFLERLIANADALSR